MISESRMCHTTHWIVVMFWLRAHASYNSYFHAAGALHGVSLVIWINCRLRWQIGGGALLLFYLSHRASHVHSSTEREGKCVCTCVWGGITGGGFSWWCIARPTFLTAQQRHKETAQLINCTRSLLAHWQSDDQMLPFSTAGGGGGWIFSCSRRKILSCSRRKNSPPQK